MHKLWVFAVILGLAACSTESEGNAGEKSDSREATKIESSRQSNPAQDELAGIIERVEVPGNKEVVIGEGVPGSIALGEWRADVIDYGSFLSILWNNRLTAVEGDGLISVIPASEVRSHALPVVDGAEGLPEDQWVSRLVVLENVDASGLIPIFRPLVSREGHLASSHGVNAVIIVDRFANANRVAQMLEAIDRKAE